MWLAHIGGGLVQLSFSSLLMPLREYDFVASVLMESLVGETGKQAVPASAWQICLAAPSRAVCRVP